MASLFPNAQAQAAGGTLLCSFPAGQCNTVTQPNKKLQVTADPRRGQLSLAKGADGLVHFKWASLPSGSVEIDRIVFPGENIFKRVQTGREGDRIYMLHCISGNQRILFWMQEKEDKNDAENMKKVNDMIENPNAAVPVVAGAAPSNATTSPAEWMNMMGLQGAPVTAAPNTSGFGNLDLSSLLNTAAPNSTVGRAASGLPPPVARPPVAAVPQAVAPPSAPLSLEDLQRAMFGTTTPGSAAPSAQHHGQQRTRAAPETPALQDIILADDVISSGILTDPSVVAALVAQLPEGQQSVEHLEGTIRSAQFQQALGSLTNAVSHPDNYGSVMSNFQINGEAGMQQLIRGDGVGAFLTSIQSQNPTVVATTPTESSTPASGGTEEKESESEHKMEE